MGKPTTKKKIQTGSKSNNGNTKQSKGNSKAFDEDTAIFINMSQELKEEGNKLFRRRDHEGAMLKYEKALKLLPLNHIDVANLRTNMAACYMQMGIGEYPRALAECNLALQVAPKYSKALLQRARCYEALERLDLALRDVNNVLLMEPNSQAALEIADSLKKTSMEKGIHFEEKETVLPPDHVEPTYTTVTRKIVKDRGRKRKSGNKFNSKKFEEAKEISANESVVKKQENYVAPEDNRGVKEETVMKSVKLVHGEDIRWAKMPVNCGVRMLKDIVVERFPNLKGVLIKYKDREDDLVTITTTDELKIAEESCDPGVLRLYVMEISPEREPLYEGMGIEEEVHSSNKKESTLTDQMVDKRRSGYEDWIVEFARLFKNHVGFESDSYLDLHEIGMRLYSVAMEDTVTSEDAQQLFEIAAAKFQEMAALALFNWGNVHLSKARKRVSLPEDASAESMSLKVKAAYDWAQKEYAKAGMRYEEALKIKQDFYEGFLALGLQRFEQAKLSWYYMLGSKAELEIEPSAQVLELYNQAEDNLEKGMQIWEEMEEKRLNGLSKQEKDEAELHKFGFEGLLKHLSPDEASEKAASIRSQIYLFWGTVLYERSVVEFKLGLPTWDECLEVAVEKFGLAGTTQTDIAVMIKNHCSNDTALEGFKVDEILQAWNEMYDSNRWQTGLASFRLESLFRRRSPQLHSVLEHR